MDSTDIKILECLKRNAREKSSAIAEEIGLSVSAVTERIRKLESSGVIKDYTVRLNQKAIGNTVCAVIMAELEDVRSCDEFEDFVQSVPNIVSCFSVTGDYSYILKVITDSSESLELICRAVKGFAGVSGTKTMLVLKTPKSEDTLLPQE